MRFLSLAGVLLLALESIGASDFGGAENGGADRLSPGYRRVADHLGRARGVKRRRAGCFDPCFRRPPVSRSIEGQSSRGRASRIGVSGDLGAVHFA
jgi:hypothetical protein